MESKMILAGQDVTADKVLQKPGLPKSKVRFFIAVLIVLVMLGSMTAASYAVTIKTVYVSLDGQVLKHAALESEGVLFLPLKTVCEGLGYTVVWNQQDWSITAKNEEKTVLFEPKKDTVTDDRHSYSVNGEYPDFGYIGGGCILVSGRTYVDTEIIESCFGVTKTYNQASNTYELSVLPRDGMTAENVKIIYEDDKLLSTVQYPKIGAANQAAADKINAVILADVEAAQKEIQDKQKEIQDKLKETGGAQSPSKFETHFNYKTPYRQGNLLSLALTDDQFFGGTGGAKLISHTFDLKTGKEFTLADLMKSDSGHAEYINESIRAAIAGRGLAEVQHPEFVSIAGDQSYYLTDKGLVVYFQQYEYFPGAAGIQEFVFPWTDLEQYLKPGFQGS